MLAGAYTISTLITQKLSKLNGSEGLKEKIAAAKKCSEEFSTKLKDNHAQLGIQGVTDENAKKAILKANAAGKDKGVEELEKLSGSLESLSKAAKEMLANSVKELTSPVVVESPKNLN